MLWEEQHAESRRKRSGHCVRCAEHVALPERGYHFVDAGVALKTQGESSHRLRWRCYRQKSIAGLLVAITAYESAAARWQAVL